VKIHPFLDERVGAHDHLDLAGLDPVGHLPLLRAAHAPQQQGRPESQGLGPPLDVAVVLLRENFRRRHEGRLVAVLAGCQHGRHADHRLAASHVALQQAVHGGRSCHVRADLTDHAFLGRREREGQDGRKPARELPAGPKGDPLVEDVARVLQGHGELEVEQLVEDEAPVGLGPHAVEELHVPGGPGKMHAAHRLDDIHQPQAFADVPGDGPRDAARVILDGSQENAAEVPLAQPLRLGVDRHDPPEVQSAVLSLLEDFEVRVDHFRMKLEDLHLPREDDPATRLERVSHVGETALEPLGFQGRRVIADQRLEDPPLLVRVNLRPDDLAHDGLPAACLDAGNGFDDASVLVFPGEEKQEVLHGFQALPGKQLPHLGAHPLDELDGLRQLLNGFLERQEGLPGKALRNRPLTGAALPEELGPDGLHPGQSLRDPPLPLFRGCPVEAGGKGVQLRQEAVDAARQPGVSHPQKDHLPQRRDFLPERLFEVAQEGQVPEFIPRGKAQGRFQFPQGFSKCLHGPLFLPVAAVLYRSSVRGSCRYGYQNSFLFSRPGWHDGTGTN